MGEAKYMVGWPNTWLAGQPAGQIFQKKGPQPGGPAGWIRRGPFFWKIWPAGWPANHVFGSTHPFWGYFYWYWYIIRCSFLNFFYPFPLKQVPKIQERVFFEKKEPLLGRPEESSPSWFLSKIDKSEFSSINLTFYPTHIDASDHIYPLGPPKPHLNRFCFFIGNMSKPINYS